MTAPLKDRLRAMYSHRGDGIPTQHRNPDGEEAADYIEKLEAELAALRPAPVDPDVDTTRQIINAWKGHPLHLKYVDADPSSFRAALAIYRKHKAEAIRPWRELVERVQGDSTTWCQGWERWHTDARALLEKTNATD